ncbi:MAG: hypothetical protein IJ083_10870 [Clostridia bacterium]|nr:hypothetical protein [Clostridia bacterium]
MAVLVTVLSMPAFASGKEDDPAFQPSRIIVSMGDSFSSGEGIPPFLGQKNEMNLERSLLEKLSDPDWLAHRSTRSWGSRLTLPGISGTMASHRNENWFFVAVSGATIDSVRFGQTKEVGSQVALSALEKARLKLDLLLDPDIQVDDEHIDTKWLLQVFGEDLVTAYSTDAAIESQLSILEKLRGEGTHVDYILMTMGGNDLDYAGIVARVILSDMTEDAASTDPETRYNGLQATLTRAVEVGLQDVSRRLSQLYSEILDEYADPATVLIIAGYPHLFSENIQDDAIGTALTRAGGQWFQSVLNKLKPGTPARSIPWSYLFSRTAGRESLGNLALGAATISKEEAKAVNGAVDRLNGAIRDIVEDMNGRGYPNICFVDVAGDEAFLGHEAYSRVPALNPLVLLKRREDLKSGNPLVDLVSAYSIHPNDRGAQGYADCVQRKIDELEALKRFDYALTRLNSGDTWYERVSDTVIFGNARNPRYEKKVSFDAEITRDDAGDPASVFDVGLALHPGAIPEAWFEHVTDLSEHAFTVKLSDELAQELGLHAESILSRLMEDSEGASDIQSLTPLDTRDVTMTMKFLDDMTLSSVAFQTTGTVRGAFGPGRERAMRMTRELVFHFSDLPAGEDASLSESN